MASPTRVIRPTVIQACFGIDMRTNKKPTASATVAPMPDFFFLGIFNSPYWLIAPTARVTKLLILLLLTLHAEPYKNINRQIS
jgi:hypothetical protein